MINLDGKIIEVLLSNIRWNLPKPKVNSHLIYLSTTNKFKEELDEISSDYEIYHNRNGRYRVYQIKTNHLHIVIKEV